MMIRCLFYEQYKFIVFHSLLFRPADCDRRNLGAIGVE